VLAAVLATAAGLLAGDPFAPILLLDRDERVLEQGVGGYPVPAPGLPRRPEGPVAYRRIARAPGGGTWRQYWLFYADNPQDRGILRTGRHRGDWELVQFRLDVRGRPREAVYAQHSGAERCPWAKVERLAGRPVVYVANGSHAAYFRAGVRDRPWPDPNDEADGAGPVLRPGVQPVTATSPRWMAWPGRWGPTRAGWVPAESDSPRGPAHQPDSWESPEAFARAARSCRAGRCDERDECDGRETAQTGAAVAALALLGGAAVRRRRRRSA